MLRIADNLKLPIDAVTQTFAVLAVRGAGKTYTLSVFAEELFKKNQQVVIVDPTGSWFGLRASADGKGPGYPVIVMGGNHGDVPLEEGAGEVVADFIVDQNASVILDVSLMRKGAQVRFMTAFSEHLYHRKGVTAHKTPLMLLLDEADRWAPQKPYPDQARLLGAIEDIVRLGRVRGFGIAMATQRAAVLNKDVLTQIETLIVLRTTSPQDRKAIDAWVEANASEAERDKVAESLASLDNGTAWFWSPSWLKVLKQVKVRARETYNSSATPKAGERRAEPKKLAPVDLERLKGQITATIEKAKANDPVELRRQLASTKAKGMEWMDRAVKAENSLLEQKQQSKVQEKRVEVPVLKDAQIRRVEAVVSKIGHMTRALAVATSKLQDFGGELLKVIARKTPDGGVRHGAGILAHAALMDFPARTKTEMPLRPKVIERIARIENKEGVLHLGKGERAILQVVAQYPEGASREQVTVITGYKRSSRDTYLQRLIQAGKVEARGGTLFVTKEGIETLGPDFMPLPTGAALREHWLQRLGGGEREILRYLIQHYPVAVDRDVISEATQYQRSSRDTYLQRLSARQLVILERRGSVKASDILFAEVA